MLDTHVLISAALLRGSVPARLLNSVLQRGRLLFSQPSFAELESRLQRSKFDRYVSIDIRRQLLHDLSAAARWVLPAELEPFALARYSRDASDDKFMQLALAGRAAFLASGDADLLVLGASHGLPVISPAQALAVVERWLQN